jgi:hypothetical protein
MKIPCGISNFATTPQQGFVDKTPYIEKLAEIIFLRL